MATEEQRQQLVDEGARILNDPLAEVSRLQAKLEAVEEEAESMKNWAEDSQRPKVWNHKVSQACNRILAILKGECTCGAPPMQPCGPTCKYPYADERAKG